MGLTNFPNGITSFGMPIFGSGLPTQGNVWFVKPASGNDAADGRSPADSFKTLARALDRAVANQNDIVFLFAESNTAGSTTDYQSSTLDWNKDMVHLIGVNAGSPFSQRSRVAFTSAYNTASNLFTVSAKVCYIANVEFFAGVAGTSPTGCMQVTGSRNVFENCHIAGIGHNNNDIAGAYSLYLNGVEEIRFKDCRIGLNAIDAGSQANSEILMANTVKNVIFQNTLIYRRIEHATNHPLVKVAAATSLDELVLFDNCQFISTSTNYAHVQAGAFKFVAAPTQGLVFVHNCLLYNGTSAGKWDVDDRDKIALMHSPTPAADTAGICRLV